VNLGKTLFAQIMDFLPWKRFHRIVVRRNADRYVKHFSCAEQFRVMAFAQLSYRESLRDIELCLGAQAAKLCPLGLSAPVKRTTLAQANERRDWHLFAKFGECLIDEARGLYREEPFGIDLAGSVYAFDASTIDLCLSLFPWAHFGRATSAKASIKLHTLLDLRGNIPSFIHLSTGRMADVRGFDKLSLEPGATYVTRPKHNTQLRRNPPCPQAPPYARPMRPLTLASFPATRSPQSMTAHCSHA